MELRPYQLDAIENLRQGMREGHKHQILTAATGAGKSVIALQMIKHAVDKGSKVLFVVDRRVLVEQFSRHLDAVGIEHGVLMADHWRWRPNALVQVASVQTLERMEYWPHFDLCVMDEVHAMMRKSMTRFLTANAKVKVIGLTATPFHPALGTHFSRVTNVITMRELVAQGFLVPFRVFAAHEVDTSGLKVVAGEWNKEQLEKRALAVVGDVVSDYVKLSNEVFGGPRKTIVFSAGVDHGAELVRRFAEVGINAVQISYRDSDEYKAEVLADFAKPDTQIQAVVSADILTRGFDVTDIEHVVLARPLRKSFSSHVQMVGRGARPHPGKNFCVIQCNSGNWLRFAEDWDALFASGAQALTDNPDTKTRKERSPEEKAQSKCPQCGHVWGKGALVCAHCGYQRVRKPLVEEVAGSLQEVKGLFAFEEKEHWYRQLLGYARNRGYADGWAAHHYREKFGVWPRGVDRTPLDPGPEVRNWVLSRIIRRKYARR